MPSYADMGMRQAGGVRAVYGPAMTDDLARLDAVAQADLVRSGSPPELVDAAIARPESER